MKQNHLLTFIFLIFSGCSYQSKELQKDEGEYFDLKGYFDAEITKFSKGNVAVRKTVDVNGATETKALSTIDWKEELSSFSNAEINRESWKGLFKKEKTPEGIRYSTNDEKVPVKELNLVYNGNRMTGVKIVIRNKNSLYSSIDSLTYFSDSLYQIKKEQHIRFLAKKEYIVTGRLALF